MEIKTRYLVIGGVVLLALGLAVGRFATPEKVITKTVIQTVEVEKIVEKKVVDEKSKENQNKKQQIHIVEVTLPDGTYKKETFILNEDTVVIEKWKNETSEKTTEKKKETIIEKDKTTITEINTWRVSGIAGIQADKALDNKLKDSLVYGAVVERRILGPIYIGGFGTSTKEAGISVGLQF